MVIMSLQITPTQPPGSDGQGGQTPQCPLLNHMEGWNSLALFLGGWSLGIVGPSAYCQRASNTADISIKIVYACCFIGNCVSNFCLRLKIIFAGCLLTVHGVQCYMGKYSTAAADCISKSWLFNIQILLLVACLLWKDKYCICIDLTVSQSLSNWHVFWLHLFSFLFCIMCYAEQNWWVVSHVVLFVVHKKQAFLDNAKLQPAYLTQLGFMSKLLVWSADF